MKKKSDFHTSDGRIDPDKAFGFVLERMKTMSSEEFVQIRDTPVVFRSAVSMSGAGSARFSAQVVPNRTPSVKRTASDVVLTKAAKSLAVGKLAKDVKAEVDKV